MNKAEATELYKDKGSYLVKVVKPFKARWCNPVWIGGKLTDLITEESYEVGDILRVCQWRPEGMHASDGCFYDHEKKHAEMFLPWDYFCNLAVF